MKHPARGRHELQFCKPENHFYSFLFLLLLIHSINNKCLYIIYKRDVCECDSRELACSFVRSFKYIYYIQCRGSGHFWSVYIDETRRDGRHAHEGENPCAHCVNGDGARGRDCVATPLITQGPPPVETHLQKPRVQP